MRKYRLNLSTGSLLQHLLVMLLFITAPITSAKTIFSESEVIDLFAEINDPVNVSYTDILNTLTNLEDNIEAFNEDLQWQYRRLSCWYLDSDEGEDFVVYADEWVPRAQTSGRDVAAADITHCKLYHQWVYDLETSNDLELELTELLERAYTLNDAQLIADVHSTLGDIYSYIGSFGPALAQYQAAGELYQTAEFEYQQGYVETEIAKTLRRLGNYELAQTYLDRLFSYYEEIDDFFSEALIAIDYGLLMSVQDRHDEAIDWYNTAIAIVEKEAESRELASGDRLDSAAWLYKAESLALTGRPFEARQAIEIAATMDDYDLESPEDPIVAFILAEIETANGNFERAETLSLQAVASFEEDENDRMLDMVLRTLINVYTAQGNTEQALKVSERRYEAKETLMRSILDQNTQRLAVQLELLSQEKENELLKLKNEQTEQALRNQGKLIRWQVTAIILGAAIMVLVLARFYLSAKRARQLEVMARTDSMTGLLNRRAMETKAEEWFSLPKEHNNQLCAALIDIDNFKSINDTFGHEAGDKVIETVSHIVRDSLRPEDWTARWGGEEFLVILPGISCEQAMRVCTRILENLRQAEHGDIVGNRTITASIGLAKRAPADKTLHQMLRRADKALYEAKENGRDQIRYDQKSD